MALLGRDRTLFRLFGVPVRANLSWLFLVALVFVSLGKGFFPARLGAQVSAGAHWALAAAGTIGLFASLIAHELCHSLVARATGMPVSGITLFIFGGVSQLEAEPPTAGAEFLMAVVGPLSSVIIASALLAVVWVGGALGWHPAAGALLSWLCYINFMLATFNSLPAFPLDGGRILRSLLWGITGNLRLATHVAVSIGSLFGLGFVFLGVFLLFMVPGWTIAGVWLMVIGFFLRQAALGTLQMVTMRRYLEGERVSRFMSPDLVTVPREMSLRQFVDDCVFTHRFSYYPVVDAYGMLVGLISARAPRQVERQLWPQTTVGDCMIEADRKMTLAPDADAVDALSALRQRGEHRVVVVHQGRPVGMVSLRDLMGFLALRIDLDRK